MASDSDPVDELIAKVRQGDPRAREQLLQHHRDRLTRMVAFRIDSRVAARLDASDIVQDALVDADRKLDEFLGKRPIPFYSWLRRLACERLVQLHRHHLGAECRDVGREVAYSPPLNDDSYVPLAEELVASGTTPSGHVVREERRQQVATAMRKLTPQDREVLAMRYMEQTSFAEIAVALDITENAAKVRHFRALERIRQFLEPE